MIWLHSKEKSKWDFLTATLRVHQLFTKQLCSTGAIWAPEEGLKRCELQSLRFRSQHRRTIVATLSACNSWTTRCLFWTPTLRRWQTKLCPRSCLFHRWHMITWWMSVRTGRRAELAQSNNFYALSGWHIALIFSRGSTNVLINS